jgi:hypothetical protein
LTGTANIAALSASGTTTLSGLTASTALALNASKQVVSVTNTGTGDNVLATSPTLVTPILGTPTSATLTNATGLPVSTGISGLGSGVATFLATPSSANLAAAVTDETGTGALVFATSPTLVTPALGTPASGVVTNLTGTASININGTVGATTASTGAFTTLTTSSTVTHNGGTANGVAYLNGSKVLTTGSALTFDGSTLGVLTANAQPVSISSSNASATLVQHTNSNASADLFYRFRQNGGAGNFYDLTMEGSTNDFTIDYNDNERLRITSAGNVGIGTSSPGYKIDAQGSTPAYFGLDATNGTRIGYASAIPTNSGSCFVGWVPEGVAGVNGDLALCPRTSAGGRILFFTGSTTPSERMRLDSSGNLGLGVTPSAWWSGIKALQFGTAGVLWSNSDRATFASNIYVDSVTNLKYINDGYALRYAQETGAHTWYSAPSGTAGGTVTFTQAMTLDASGNLMVGGTNNDPFGRAFTGTRTVLGNNSGETGLTFRSGTGTTSYLEMGSGSTFLFSLTSNASGTQLQTTTAVPLIFSTNAGERARITSGGDLLVGTTSQIGSEKFGVDSGSGAAGKFKGGSDANVTLDMWNPATSGDNIFAAFRTETAETTRGSITYNRTAGLVAYNVTSDYRAKDISGPVTDSGALIDSVPVYMGKMKGATQERPMFIAHEVPAYAHTGEKDAVDDDGKPVYQQMDASALIPVMWAEIQSLRARLAALEAA